MLAHFLLDELGKDNEVLLSVNDKSKSRNNDFVAKAIRSSDVFVPLLSEESIFSEVLIEEISIASDINRSYGGRPLILPIRVNCLSPFPYPLSAYLNHLSWYIWQSSTENLHLAQAIVKAMAGGNLPIKDIEQKRAIFSLHKTTGNFARPHLFANPVWLERPDGTMNPDSRLYIERFGDIICNNELMRGGTTIVIEAARQMGKSSMLVRSLQRSRTNGKRIAFLDFQLLDDNVLKQPRLFYKNFCHWIVKELSLPDSVETVWTEKSWLGDIQLCTDYMENRILKTLKESVVLAIDEADRMIGCEFRSDFFGMLRAWHNSRRSDNEWGRLDILLVISTEPYALVDNLEQSPFNVGEVIRLSDFTTEQVIELNERQEAVLTLPQIDNMMTLLAGHPYLTRLAMYLILRGDYSTDSLFKYATSDRGPFGDHLRHMNRVIHRSKLVKAMKEIINYQTCSDEEAALRLHQAGLVCSDGEQLRPRCELYIQYFHKQKQLGN